MRVSTIAVIILATFASADAARVKAHDAILSDAINTDGRAKGTQAVPTGYHAQEYVTCSAVGEVGGDADGMTVTWGVPKNKCMALCSPTSAQGPTYRQAFTQAFAVSFDKKCQCSNGGKVVVAFTPQDDRQAQQCADGTAEMHKLCWRMYQKGRGTRFIPAGKLRVPSYTVPFSPSDFVVNRGCSTPCNDASCHALTLPGALDGMDHEDKARVGQAIKDVMNGKEDDVDGALIDLIDILPQSDFDMTEFAAIDADGDGQLSVEELAGFFTNFKAEQIKVFVDAVDEDGNGQIGPDEFHAFKEQMRDFKPDVDITPDSDAESSIYSRNSTDHGVAALAGSWSEDEEGVGGETEEIQEIWHTPDEEAKAEWVCMKDGKPAPGECEGSWEYIEEPVGKFAY